MAELAHLKPSFIEFAKARKRSRPESIGPADFWALSELMLVTEKKHRKTARDRLIIVKQMFKWAITKAKPKMLRENPIESEDGVTEARSPTHEMLNLEPLRQAISAANDSPADVIKNLRAAVIQHQGDSCPVDDQTMVVAYAHPMS